MLEDGGYRVTPAVGGADALEKFGLTGEGIDLVLTDLNMPDISGIRLARAIKGLRPDIPVVLISTHDLKGFGEFSAVIYKYAAAEKVLPTLKEVFARISPA